MLVGEIPRPSHFSVEDDGSSLRMSFRWISRGFMNAAVKCLVWGTLFVVGLTIVLTCNDPFIICLLAIFSTPFVAFGLLGVYATLAVLVNNTVVKVTSEFLTVKHGPLPWWGNRSLPIDELERLCCYKHTRKDSASVSYSVDALTNGGNKIDLVRDLLNVAEALFIKQELERWLKINDSSIVCEMHH